MIFAVMATAVNAQSWHAKTIKGDELLGIEQSSAFVFEVEEKNWSFVIYNNKPDDFHIYAANSVFDFMNQGANGGKLVKGTVGFYDENATLIDKIKEYCFESIGSYYGKLHSNKYSRMGGNNKKNAKKIIEYLKNGKGFVRFVIPIYNSAPLDMTVPCINNDKLTPATP